MIKTYLKSIVDGEKLNISDFKINLLGDLLHSNMLILRNDAIAPFVEERDLKDVINGRIQEGQFGFNAVQRFNEIKENFRQTKQNDESLTPIFHANIKEVGNIEKTYKKFIEAIAQRKEIEGSVFSVPSAVVSEKVFKPHELLIVENEARFEDMYEKKDLSEENKLAVCSVATILLLKGIASIEEENEVDDLAEQVYPYVLLGIRNAGVKYIGDEALYEQAKTLAKERLNDLNIALGENQTYFADFDKLLADEKIYQEINKVANKFSDYRINFYGEGTNPPISDINDQGQFDYCDIEDEDYNLFEKLDKLLLNSVVDTDEEVLQAMFANLFTLQNSYHYDEKTQEQLTKAFALPLVQSMNTLGTEKSSKLIQDVVEKFKQNLENNEEFVELLNYIHFDGACLQKENQTFEFEEELVSDEDVFDPEAMQIYRELYPRETNGEVTEEEANTNNYEVASVEELLEDVPYLLEAEMNEGLPNENAVNDLPWYSDEELAQKDLIADQKPVVANIKPVKEITADKIRKTLVKKITIENSKFYNKIQEGKVKCKGKNVDYVLDNLTELAGEFALNEKRITCYYQSKYMQAKREAQDFVSKVITNFYDEFIQDKANDIMIMPNEERKDALKVAEKEVSEFYKNNVKKSKELDKSK